MYGLDALAQAGVHVADAEIPMELARSVKTPDEINAMRHSAAVCDAAVTSLLEALQPGISELQLWTRLISRAFELGAEYTEARLLVSGPRTNPWLQEASERILEPGDLVAFDTDIIGPNGYETDISRTYLCGNGRSSSEQRRLYSIAHEFVTSALTHVRPGRSFEDLGRSMRSDAPAGFVGVYPLLATASGGRLSIRPFCGMRTMKGSWSRI